MKKLVLLAAAIGLAAAPPVSARKLVKLDGNLKPVATLESGKTYLIYDASKIKGPEIGADDDAERASFRYVTEGDEYGEIWGDYELNPASEATIDFSTYAWIANGSEEEGFSFQNVDTGLYIPKNNNYTSWEGQDDMMVTEEEVKFHLLQTEPDGNYHVVGFDDSNIWDGRWWDDECRMTSYWKAGDYAGNHWYQFFEVTDDMIIEDYQIVIRVYDRDGTYLDGKYYTVAGDEYPAGSKITFPEVLDGELIVSDGAEAAFTVKEDCQPFKLVSARHRNRWAACFNAISTNESEDGLGGSWFIEKKEGEYSKFFAINQLSYIGEIFDSEAPTGYAADASQANLFRIDRNDSGAECIYNSHNDIAFNIRNYNVAGWGLIDSGSYWFMVYDPETYEANKESFFGETTGELTERYISPFQTSLAGARTVAKNAARIEKTDEEWTAAITRLNNAIMAAETARFGVKGTDIPAIVRELDDAKNAIPARDIAIGLYESLVGTKYDDGAFYALPGYADPYADPIVDLYNAIADGTDSEITDAMVAAESASIDTNYEPFDFIVYTLRSTDLDALGYLCNRNGAMVNTKAPESIDFDPANPDFHFTVVSLAGGRRYLYNIGAGMFMNAFGMQTDNDDETVRNRSDYSWRFSDMPTEIICMLPFDESTPRSFTILAGLAPSNSEGFTDELAGGLSMTANGSRPNIVAMGITNPQDGNGLLAEYVRKLTFGEWDAIFQKAKIAIEEATSRVAEIPETISLDGHIVNHYTYETVMAIKSATDADHQHYLMETGTRQQPIVGTAYTLVDENENAWCVTPEGNVTTVPLSEMTDENKSYYHWILAANSTAVSDPEEIVAVNTQTAPTYSFIHVHDGKRIALAIDGVTDHKLGTQTLGKVKIAGTDYVMASALGDATTGDGSTSIAEISDGTPSDEIYYDLQGRRVTSPVKGGIYMTANGKKIIF